MPSGYRIEEYEIGRVPGAGGFGITYLANDTKLDGPVAIKEYFPREHAERKADQRVTALPAEESRALFTWGLDRFLEEARSIHRFRHPNVVRVHRYVEALGTACIVMEYFLDVAPMRYAAEGHAWWCGENLAAVKITGPAGTVRADEVSGESGEQAAAAAKPATVGDGALSGEPAGEAEEPARAAEKPVEVRAGALSGRDGDPAVAAEEAVKGPGRLPFEPSK